MEKISIIVAIYNSEKFLRKLIESIINQTYRNLEIILVNDGSPDNSGKICDEYKEKDSRITVIHKINGGTCDARNAGLKIATGEYVSIIDGDDWLELDYVEYLMNIIKSTGSEMAMTDNIFTTRDRVQVTHDKIEVWSNEEAACSIIYPIIAIGPWNKLYRMSVLKEHNLSFSVPWSGEGLYFSCMAAQYSNQVGVGHRKIYNYRLNNAGSGLTNYKVEMGINALNNIQNIREISVIRTSKMLNAIDWHVWKNYYYAIFLIVATKSQNENRVIYKSCLRSLRIKLLKVLLTSDFGIKEKIKMIIKGFFPVYVAKKELFRRRSALAKDKMD